MILSLDGSLGVLSAYVNLLTLASLLGMSTETTLRFAEHPIIKALILFSFAFSVVPHTLPCLIATLLFFIFEVKNFVTGVVSSTKKDEDGENIL
jgi:hypothetical protein